MKTRRQVRRAAQDQKDDLFLEARREVEEEAGLSPFAVAIGEYAYQGLRGLGVSQKLAGPLTSASLPNIKNTNETAVVTERMIQAMKSNTEALIKNTDKKQQPQVRTEPAAARLGRSPRVEPSF